MSCAGTIAGLVAGLVLANAEPVVIGTEAPFPAYTYLAEDGTITGHDRDLMDDICARMLWRCEWQNAHFDELIPGVMSGRFDIIIGGIAVTPERRDLVDFTQAFDSSDPEEWYLGFPGAPEPEQALIGVQSGTVHEAHLRRLGLSFQSYVTEPQVLDALVQGATDLALGPFSMRADLETFIQGHGLEFLYSDTIPDEGIAMAVCKGNAQLLDSLNAALDAMRGDGTLEEIESRWF
ncbi:MAG: amino acid ABC transporter substrate-binding protein [Tabrizicola sp.]|nr:amino acid ABC transporter substrate-binding protein [Tabrizicola sp.]